jgi:hypothetical protein
MLIRNNYEVPTSVCIDMAQLRFLFCLGGGAVVNSKIGNDYIDENDSCYDNESFL